jgi:hypothetical protein
MFPHTEKIINYYKILNKNDFTSYNDDIEFIFVELNKFIIPLETCHTEREKGPFFLKNAGSLKSIPQNLPQMI